MGTVILTDIDEDNGPQFGKICKIYKINDAIKFSLQPISTITFHKHYHAYIVKLGKNQILTLDYKNLPNFAPCLLIKKPSNTFVVTKYAV